MKKKSNMEKQTAVEWLVEQLFNTYEKLINEDIIEQAKKMEKEQIEEAFAMGNDDISSEQYYKETYKQQ